MKFNEKKIELDAPKVMGILNMTPDSFSDGGKYLDVGGKPLLDKVLQTAEDMQQAGATFIDIGGESTRPGAESISLQEEMDRVLPVVEIIHKNLDIIISLDTSSPELILEGARLGVGLINDVRALQKTGAVEAVGETGLPVCLMHMQGEPKTMQHAPHYNDLLKVVLEFLEFRISVCIQAGIDHNKIIIDPGFGFGKTLEHNLELLGRLHELLGLKCPILIGLSRKSMLGSLTEKPTEQRIAAGISAAILGMEQGANIIRTHDVSETVDAVKVFLAVKNNELK